MVYARDSTFTLPRTTSPPTTILGRSQKMPPPSSSPIDTLIYVMSTAGSIPYLYGGIAIDGDPTSASIFFTASVKVPRSDGFAKQTWHEIQAVLDLATIGSYSTFTNVHEPQISPRLSLCSSL